MMRLKAPDSRSINNPTEKQLVEAIRALDAGNDNPYLILVDTAHDNVFMQMIKKADGRFFVEYRDPSGRQYSSPRVPEKVARAAFLSYALGDAAFRDLVQWHDITKKLEKLSPGSARPRNSARSNVEDRVSVAVPLLVLARAILTLNRGTVDALQDDGLLKSLTVREFRKLKDLAQLLDNIATKMDHLASRIGRRTPSAHLVTKPEPAGRMRKDAQE